MKHGLYAKDLAPGPLPNGMGGEAGLGEEIETMRELGGGLLERQAGARRDEALLLIEAYTLNAVRVAELQEMERLREAQAQREQEDISGWEDIVRDCGYPGKWPPDDEELRRWVGVDEKNPGLKQEMAAMRNSLRCVAQLARKAGEPAEYVRLVGLYAMGCRRLMRLVRLGSGRGWFMEYLRKMVDEAIRQVNEEWKREREEGCRRGGHRLAAPLTA